MYANRLGNIKMKIKELKTRIANNKTKEVIDTLMDYLSENNNEFYNEIIVLSSKFEQTKKEFRGGNLAQADRNTEIVRINYALLEMIDEIFAIDSPKNTLKKAVDNLKVISNNNQKLFISTEGLEQAIKIHIKETSTWARVISFKDVKQAKSTQNVYVELDCYVTPKRTHIESDNYCEKNQAF